MLTILSAALPSPNGLGQLLFLLSIYLVLRTISEGSAPAKILEPTSRVSGRSVLYLSVTQGTLRMHASSCTPPESVKISLALLSSFKKLK